MFLVCADDANVCADYVPNMSDIRHTFDTHDFIVCSQFLHNGQSEISSCTICTIGTMTSKEQSLATTLKVLVLGSCLAKANNRRKRSHWRGLARVVRVTELDKKSSRLRGMVFAKVD